MSAYQACDALAQLEDLQRDLGRVQSRHCAQHGPVVVKRMHARGAEAEINARRIIAAVPGVQVPAVLAQRADDDVTYLELARADRCRETRMDDLLEIARALALATADPERTVDVAGTVRERLDRITNFGPTPVSALAEAVAADIPRCWVAPASFCHGDLHSNNVIPTRTGIALVDWEHSAWLSSAWELSKMAIVADVPVAAWEQLARQAGINRRQFQILARLHAVEGLHYAVERENRDHELWRERARRTGLAGPRAVSDR